MDKKWLLLDHTSKLYRNFNICNQLLSITQTKKNTKDMIKMDTYVYSEIRAPYLPSWNRKAYLSFINYNVLNGKTYTILIKLQNII